MGNSRSGNQGGHICEHIPETSVEDQPVDGLAEGCRAQESDSNESTSQ